MFKRVFAGLSALALFATGCSTDTEDFCARMDECNLIPAGNSVDDCVNDTDRGLERLSDAEYEDATRVLDDCMEFETCQYFSTCAWRGAALLPK